MAVKPAKVTLQTEMRADSLVAAMNAKIYTNGKLSSFMNSGTVSHESIKLD